MGIFDFKRSAADVSLRETAAPAPLAGTRSQAMHRMQIGFVGLGGMLLLIGLASIITERASESEAARVPEASATIAPAETPVPKSDPLVDAGVVPDLPIADPDAAAGTPGPVLPEQGKANAPKQ